MATDKDFETRLTAILSKYKIAIESKDPSFIHDYISHCLDHDTIVSPKNFGRNTKSFLKVASSIILKVILIILLISGSLLYAKHKVETAEIDEYSTDANYWLFFFRRWGVRFGLNQLTFVKRLYEKDCLIANPYYVYPPRECNCGFQLKRYQLTDTHQAQNSFLRKLRSGNSNPFIMKNGLDFPVSYTDLRAVVLEAAEDFDSGHSFTKTLSGSSVSSDYKTLFSDSEAPPQHSNAAWEMNFVGAAHHMRSLFPRPFFIPSSQEVHLARTVFMFGSQAPKDDVRLSTESYNGAFYIQSWGSRNYTLTSDPTCKCKQNSMTFKLEAGDMLYYAPDVHDLSSSASNNDSGYSIGYVGSVATEVSKKVK